ncbi:MAG: HD domain-containing protein [Lachnospiraceae bacterium]|jgi:HD-GYP domain-containing protein (c-di-GMP phosphodiesterase class II)|nr:HD domain-containing protein [Lachnospiraceae bacterium]
MEHNRELQVILDVGIALSAERDVNRLFNLIIANSMAITNCDAGTLYLLEDNVLKFKIMKTLSLNIDKGSNGETIELPPVDLKEENICAYSAIYDKALNIEDVYNSDLFDFSGPKRYDKLTGYRTQSMLVVPLSDHDGSKVGVLQLLNAKDTEGNTIPFSQSYERIVLALASQTAIAVSNMRYREELKEQMWSFTEAMAAAIDERTPYNASHTRNVAKYSGKIADYITKLHDEGKEENYFDEHRREQLVMGAYLHDIGKIAVPLEVMNKATRLNGGEREVKTRFEIFDLKAETYLLSNKISREEYDKMLSKTAHAYDVVKRVNDAGFLNDDLRAELEEVLAYDFFGEPFFREIEKECLRVVKGTLTTAERKIMEDHVVITERILSKVHFNKYFANSPKIAVKHHECLNGKGYPKGLTAEDLTLDDRIIAVADICDALLATDRPYKKPIPKEKAFDIMRGMAKDGNIDGRLVEYLYECIDD